MIRAVILTLALLPASALAEPPASLSPADEAAAFRAAGFARVGQQWQICGDPGTLSYTPGAIESVADLNGDGRPEAVVTEGSVFCFGGSGQGYAVVSKQAPTPTDKNGSWRLVTGGEGIVRALATPAKVLEATSGWPDLEIGGPGFCHPVHRWNGRVYALHRHEYEGKACKG